MSRIAVCTPTRNRRWAWEWSRFCFDHQEIPADRLDWIIVDNSSDPTQDWSVSQSHPRVRYTRASPDTPLSDLRNLCLDEAYKTDCEYIVFWDDDDYYPPTRISSGIRALEEKPDAQYAGANTLFLFLVRENRILRVGPYGEKHSTCATWTVRRSYAETSRFKSGEKRAEETAFMRNWVVPMALVKPEECILVMGHSQNTVDKSQVASQPGRFMAAVTESANGRMMARVNWFRTPEVWDMWRSTFSAASSAPPRATTSDSPTEVSVTIPTLHTEATA